MAAELTHHPAWKALAAHYEQMRNVHLRTLFADDPARGERFAIGPSGGLTIRGGKRGGAS